MIVIPSKLTIEISKQKVTLANGNAESVELDEEVLSHLVEICKQVFEYGIVENQKGS